MPFDNRDASCLWDMYQAAKGIVKAMKGVNLERYNTDENLRLMIERRIEIIEKEKFALDQMDEFNSCASCILSKVST